MQIATSAIPATPAAAACKKNLDAAATQFNAGGIDKVTQIAGANTTNYVRTFGQSLFEKAGHALQYVVCIPGPEYRLISSASKLTAPLAYSLFCGVRFE